MSSGIPNRNSGAVRNMTPNTIGERIQRELDADPDKSAAEAAKYAGLGKSTLTELIKGRSKSSTKLHLIAEYLGVTPKWLETGKGPKHPISRAVVGISTFDETRPQTPVRQIPVRGTAIMGADGFWMDLEHPEGGNDGYFEHPTNDPDAYIIAIKGDAYHPSIRSGWCALIEPNGTIQPGEFVLVLLQDGRSAVSELLWHRNGEYALQALAGGARLTLSHSDLEGIYPVGAVLPPSKRKF
jgi:SOS-response transcriptional repressor LexA